MINPARPNLASPLLLATSLAVMLTACGGGRDPILGANGIAAAAPTVTSVSPVEGATGIAITGTVVSAGFDQPMAPLTGNASFTLTCAAPCVSPSGVVALDSTQRIATFSLAPLASLTPLTFYTATLTAVRSESTGLPMDAPYSWQFFTAGSPPDLTRPRVALTSPASNSPGSTTGVPANMALAAVFSESMAPATLNAASFLLSCAAPCVAPAGTVTYSVADRTALFTPAATLAAGTTYTATVTSAATDLAGNALAGNQAALPAASNYLWTFSTIAATAAAPVTVQSTSPAAGSASLCTNAAVNASFTVPSGARLDPASLTNLVFTVTGPAPALTPVLAGSVLLDTATGQIATFTPAASLSPGVTYTATIRGGATGVKDLTVPANGMASDISWNFNAVTCAASLAPAISTLGSVANFGVFGGTAGMTSQGSRTVVNGDIGSTTASSSVTGFHDLGIGCSYTETTLNTGTVNGKIYTATPPPSVACPTEGTAFTFAIARQAAADALSAYNALVAMPAGTDPGAGNLANRVLTPGVYTAASGSFLIRGGDLTLDAQGNANAVWVFQMASSLTVGGPGAAAPQSVILVNGAQSRNVFWQVGSAATVNAGGGGTMVGTVISRAGAAVSTAGAGPLTTFNGRALSLGASVTLVDTVINVPAH